jgi:hypothetical protein
VWLSCHFDGFNARMALRVSEVESVIIDFRPRGGGKG